MRIEEVEVYTIDELPEEVRARVIEKWREDDRGMNFEFTQDEIIADETERLAELGFEDAEISYSGFWSQGDGASFTATINLEKFLDGRRLKTKYKKLLALNEDIDATIGKSQSHYSHEYTMFADLSPNYYSDLHKYTDQLTELEELIQEEAREEARAIYEKLRKAYEYQSEDEQILEDIRINEHEFTIGGQLW